MIIEINILLSEDKKSYHPDTKEGDFIAIEWIDYYTQKSYLVQAGGMVLVNPDHTLFVSHDTSREGRTALRHEMVAWEELNSK